MQKIRRENTQRNSRENAQLEDWKREYAEDIVKRIRRRLEEIRRRGLVERMHS